MPPRKQSTETRPIYQAKITLKDSRPPIWRRVLLPANLTFAQLHDVLQLVMGWTDSHLHEFTVRDQHIGPLHPDNVYPVQDERRVRLHDVVDRERFKFRYQYDFGDDWQHEIVIEKVLPPDPQQPLPFCIKGKRACPPEDVGGVWGYDSLLEALADPTHPEHDSLLEWLDGKFDPEAFDPALVNAELQAAFRP